MKKTALLLFIPLILLSSQLYAQHRDIYQIKTYLMNTEQQMETTENFLKDAYLPALKRIGIKSVGVFKPKTIDSDSIKKVMVLIPFTSLEQFAGLDNQLLKDNHYLTAGANYLNAPFNKKPYLRIESTLLQAFSEHPHVTPTPLTGPRDERVYELRSYEASTEAILKNKIEMFNKGGEIKLFDSLNFNAVFYGEVISGDKMPNLMYMTTFSNQASRDELWKAFFSSPEWKVLSAKTEYKNNVSKADIIFFTPTEYSDY
ncbi:NIPSNAP family protein [Confluentibacter flavum]|uniref:NIPSNAP family containing protein n=1 Tax=Confluentibacter flavum TaxID=1909700 RepID=A0A2N3HEV0_9FLAO|nr:NIPSNAP family protein [Confluentibacter flavum]PKQ43510.1 NIPSNAP family containing protein [Confluentibacter flavum]